MLDHRNTKLVWYSDGSCIVISHLFVTKTRVLKMCLSFLGLVSILLVSFSCLNVSKTLFTSSSQLQKKLIRSMSSIFEDYSTKRQNTTFIKYFFIQNSPAFYLSLINVSLIVRGMAITRVNSKSDCILQGAYNRTYSPALWQAKLYLYLPRQPPAPQCKPTLASK